jgi:hypothetical protein
MDFQTGSAMIRKLLFALLALGLTASEPAEAFGPKTQFRLAVLSLSKGENERTTGLQRLAYEVRKRTSIEAAQKVETVTLVPESLFDYPFVVLPVCRALRPLTEGEVQLLRRFLDLGGFLFVDNCPGRANGPAELWVRTELGRIYPERPLKPLPADHSLSRSFYLIDRAWGRTGDRANLEGVDDGDRTIIVYHPNDMLGALLRDPFGNPIFDMPERQREMAQRQGINLVLYALTLNYKKDQIHIPFILKRRQQ